MHRLDEVLDEDKHTSSTNSLQGCCKCRAASLGQAQNNHESNSGLSKSCRVRSAKSHEFLSRHANWNRKWRNISGAVIKVHTGIQANRSPLQSGPTHLCLNVSLISEAAFPGNIMTRQL